MQHFVTEGDLRDMAIELPGCVMDTLLFLADLSIVFLKHVINSPLVLKNWFPRRLSASSESC